MKQKAAGFSVEDMATSAAATSYWYFPKQPLSHSDFLTF